MDNESIVNLIATDGSASDVSNAIKNALYARASEKIDELKPLVATSMFGGDEETTEDGE
jgi:hypothetical protein